jgi:hypothetical protein
MLDKTDRMLLTEWSVGNDDANIFAGLAKAKRTRD